MSDFLAEMAASSRLRAERAWLQPGPGRLTDLALANGRPAELHFSDAGFDVIAEAKLASPSEGRLTGRTDDSAAVAELATTLASSGALALSVLTEPSRFSGNLEHLQVVCRNVDRPVMRKDFLVDPIQVFEAAAAGASGVLLISRILAPDLLVEMTDIALDLGMFVLVELFDEDDIDNASRVFDRDVLLGVNARDLTTLQVEPERHELMASQLPPSLHLVAESGIASPEDARRVVDLGYRLALVGTALVRSEQPGLLLTELLEAGRAASTGVS